MPNLPYISPDLLRQYQREVASQTSPATTKRRMAALKRFFGWAHKEGHIPENPIQEIPTVTVSAQEATVARKSRFKPSSLLKLGIPVVLVLLIFLLARKVKLPIPFLPAPAQEETAVVPRPTSTPLPQIQDTGATIASLKEEVLKLVAAGVEWATFTDGNLLIGGTPVSQITLSTGDTTDGDITINPDGSGIAHFLFEGTGENFLNAQAPNLNSGSLYYGIVANNATGYDLIRLQSGSKPITRFSVDALGNTDVGGNLNIDGNVSTNDTVRLTSAGALTNITGYSQTSGNFNISQGAGDSGTITKKASALSDLLTLTLDERTYGNSSYSTLTLKRYDGSSEAYALFVDEGNARLDGQLQLGRFSSNPTTIGTGSIVYNSTDNKIYFWNGSAWTEVGAGGTLSFASITSGTNTSAAMVVGSGASLSFADTGTITASEITCVGCVANSELANSSITFAADTGSSVTELGGTRTIAGGEGIDTSESAGTITIAGEDATTTNKGIASFDSIFFTVASGAVSIANDSLNFAQFSNNLSLDASTDIALGASTLSTSGTGALNFTSTGQVTFAGNVDATNGLDVTGASLTVGTSYSWTTGGVITAATDETINGLDISSGVVSDVVSLALVTAGNTWDSTGNLTTSGNLDINGTSNDIAGTLNLSGNTLTSSGDLTINAIGNNILSPDSLNFGGATAQTYNFFAASTAGASAAMDTATDLYVQGDLEVDGTIYGNVSGTINPGFTTGSVIFQGPSGLAQDNPNFFWDDTNNKLGIGTSSPTSRLHIETSASALLGKAALIINQNESEDIFTASASGDPRLALTNTGNLQFKQTSTIDTSTGNLTLGAAGNLVLNSTGNTIDIDDSTIDLSTQSVGITLNNVVDALNFDSNTLSIDALNNRVGIGTTGPNNPLEISSTSFPQLRLQYTGDTTYMTMGVGTDAGVINVVNPTAGDGLRIQMGGAEKVRVDNNGNVGIGTTSPTNILSLGNAADRKFWIEDTAAGTVGRALTVAAGGTVAGGTDITGGNLILQAGLGTGTGASTISFQTGTTLGTGTTLQTMSTKMTILGNGNVGIGTTGPTELLHVVGGNIRTTGAFIVTGRGQVLAGTGASDLRVIGVGNLELGGNSSVHATITTAGNVGIGTTSPTSKLHLTGAVTGKALAIFDETGDQNIFTASASSTPKLTILRDGTLQFHQASSITTTTGNLTIDSAGTLVINDNLDLSNAAKTVTLANVTNALNIDANTLSIDASADRVGIGTASPGQKLDVVGAVQFSTALMPGGTAGNSGQFLISQGAGVAPVWTSTVPATSLKWNALTDPDGALTLAHGAWTTTMGWTATGALDPWTMNLINNAGTATTQRFVNIVNAVTSQTVDVNTEALLRLDNADTSASGGLTIVDDAILITNTGGITNGVTDAIDASAVEIVNALNAGPNVILGTTAAISFTNFAVSAAGNITVQGGYGLDTNAAGTLALGETTATTINIGTNATARTIALGGTGANTIAIGNTQTAGSISLGAAMTGGTISIGGTGAQTGTISLGTGTGGQTISLGTGAGAKAVSVGSTNSTSSLTLNSGSGVIDIGTSIAKTITIGNTTGATGILERVGTGNYSLDGVAGSIYAIGASTTTGTITIGGTAQTGLMTLGKSSGTNIVEIGAGEGATTVNIAGGATNAKTINLGTGAAMANNISLGGTGANTIAIGNTQAAGSIAMGAAMTTGTITIGGTGLQTGTIGIGTGTGAQAINLGTGGTGAKTVTLGSQASSSSLTLDSGTGAINIGTAIAKIISIGNTTGASATSLNAGSGNLSLNATSGNLALSTTTAGNITIAPGGAGDINVTTDADSFLNLAGLTSSSGSVLCIDGSNNVVTCTSGGGILWNQIGNPNGNLTLTHGAWTTTMGWTATGALNPWTMNLTNNAGSATTQNFVTINNASNTSASTDVNTENLLLVQQLDTATGNSIVVDNAVKIDSAGAAGITDAIEITNSAGDITNGINLVDTAGGTFATGINFSGTFTNEISLRNAETISNATDGTITLGANSGAVTLSLSGTAATISNTAGNLTVNAASNLVLADATIQLTGGTTVTMDLFNASTTTLSILNSTGGVAADVNIEGDLTVQGGDITGANSETIDIGDAQNGAIIFTGAGGTNNGSLTIDLETNTIPTFTSSTGTAIGIDEDLTFIGAQSITTTAGNLTLDSAGGSVILNTDDDLIPTLGAGDADIGASGTRWDNIYAVAGNFSGTVTINDLICTDCLDFTEFEDTLDLDAALTLNQSTNTWTQNFDGTTTTGFTYNADSLTSGMALSVVSDSATVSTAFTGDLLSFSYAPTYTGGVGLDTTGNLLDISRSVTLNNAGNTLTVSGAVATIADAAFVTAGTLTHSADVLRIAQNYDSNTGAALNITTIGTGLALRVNDTGVFTDTTPFVVDYDGRVGIGMVAPNNKLDVSSAIRSGTHATGAPLYVTGEIGASSGGIEFRHSNATQGIGFGYNTIYAAGTAANQNINILPKGSYGVGIGATTVPTANMLSVFGSAVIGDGTYYNTAAPSNGLLVQGGIGIGTTGPDRKLDVLDATNPQLRLTQADGTVYTDFRVDSNGDLTITPSGGDIFFSDGTNTLASVKDQGDYVFWNLKGKSTTGNPAACAEGDIYYNASDDTVYVCHFNNVWEQLDGGGGASTLQAAYEGGNTISVISGEGNLAFTLTSADFTITTPTGGSNFTSFLRADGAGTADPAQLVLIDNLDADRAQPIGLKIQSAGGGMTTAIDVSDVEIDSALYAGANFVRFDALRIFEGTSGTLTIEDTSGNDMLQIINQGATGRLAVSDSLQVGGLTTVAYSRFGTANSTIGAVTAKEDLLISGDLEVDGGLYLDGKNLYNPQGTNFLTICIAGGATCATPSEIEHTLTNGSWTIENPSSGNVGKAALIVVQNKGGDLFTASAGATTKFKIANDGNVTISGSGTMLTVGGGTGKVDVGTVDPVYNILGTKYATYMAGMVGVKEETTGKIITSQYIPGVGYQKVLDFKTEPEGSDLWLFSRTTNIKNNIDKMVVLLSPSDNTRTWYEVDEANYTLSIYSSRPTTISYRLTAPRFDYAQWSNYNDNPEATGFQVEDSPLVGTGEENTPKAPTLSDFEIVKEVPQTVYKVFQTISEGSKIVIDEFGAFANLVAGNIKAGAIESKEIATESFLAFQGTIDNLLITNGLVSPTIQTETISPLADKSDVKVQIGNENIDSGFGKLIVQNSQGEEVASIDTSGNATFSGTLEASEVKTNEVIAGKIYADEIVARSGFFTEINTASVSGITREEIEKILREVEQDQQILTQASTWNVNTATDSANLEELAVSNLYVTDQAAISTLSVTSSISLGPDLVLQSNSIDTLSAPLSIQSLALAPVEIMAGKVKIDTNGDVTISGNLYVAGKIESSGLTLKDTSGFGELLKLKDTSGNQVAAISASGSAQFASLLTDKLIIAGGDTAPKIADVNQEIQTNATAGSAIISAGVTEITIKNPNISDYTLVYVTPTSSTRNNVLYVKAKGQGFFTVGFSQAPSTDVTFNWWVIDMHE